MPLSVFDDLIEFFTELLPQTFVRNPLPAIVTDPIWRAFMEGKKIISAGELENVSGGQKVYDYYHNQVFCRECGGEDFTCLGWKEKPNGNCTAGYEFKCNRCGYTFIEYYR